MTTAVKKVFCDRESVYPKGESKPLPLGVVELDAEIADGLIKRGLVSEYSEPKVNKVETKKETGDKK